MKHHWEKDPPRKVTVLGAFSAASGIAIDAELVSDVPAQQQADCAMDWLRRHAQAWLRLAGISEDVIMTCSDEEIHAAARDLAQVQAERSKNDPIEVLRLWNALAKPRAGMEAAARALLPTRSVDNLVDLAKAGFRAAHQHARVIDPELAGRLVEDLMKAADECVTEMVTGERPAPPPEPLPQIDVSDLEQLADEHSGAGDDLDLEGEED